MRKLKIKGHLIEIYDSIEEMPMRNFHKYNKMLLIDSGIGSDLSDFDRHVARVGVYLKEGKTDLAVQEIENLRQNIYNIQSGITPKMYAFACLVAKIDNEEQTDISDARLFEIAEMLGAMKRQEMTDNMDSVKKKMDEELIAYFPNIFESSSLKEIWDKVKRRTMMVLAQITKGEDNSSEIQSIDRELVTYSKPKKFSGRENEEVAYDKQYERLSLSIMQNLNAETRNMTVLQFYSACEMIGDIAKEREKAKKRK